MGYVVVLLYLSSSPVLVCKNEFCNFLC